MPEMKSIDIDFQVHKRIEQEKRDFSETPNEILHRLLKIEVTKRAPVSTSNNQKRLAWSDHGITLPHGTLARFTYNKCLYEAIIDNGKWKTHDGDRHTSASGAASSVAKTKAGSKTALNGLILWEVKRPEDKEWKKLDSLRSVNTLG